MHHLDRAAGSAIASFRPLLSLPKAGARFFRQGSVDIRHPCLSADNAPSAPGPSCHARRGRLHRRRPAGRPGHWVNCGLPGWDGRHPPVHQRVLVSVIHTTHARINLYQLRSLYGLSLPGAYTALGVIAFVYGLWAIKDPAEEANAIQIGLSLVFAAIAVTTFAWPLL